MRQSNPAEVSSKFSAVTEVALGDGAVEDAQQQLIAQWYYDGRQGGAAAPLPSPSPAALHLGRTPTASLSPGTQDASETAAFAAMKRPARSWVAIALLLALSLGIIVVSLLAVAWCFTSIESGPVVAVALAGTLLGSALRFHRARTAKTR